MHDVDEWKNLTKQDRADEIEHDQRQARTGKMRERIANARHERMVAQEEARSKIVRTFILALIATALLAGYLFNGAVLDTSDRAYGSQATVSKAQYDRLEKKARRVYRQNRSLKKGVRYLRGRNRELRMGQSRVPRRWTMGTAHASWYGPGLWGNHTASGSILRTSTRGVAHKSKPFGTLCLFQHGSRVTIVPVIDRGPYIKGRDFDLTGATASYLGFTGTGKITYACNG